MLYVNTSDMKFKMISRRCVRGNITHLCVTAIGTSRGAEWASRIIIYKALVPAPKATGANLSILIIIVDFKTSIILVDKFSIQYVSKCFYFLVVLSTFIIN